MVRIAGKQVVVGVLGKALTAEGHTFIDPIYGWLTVSRVHMCPQPSFTACYASYLYCRAATRNEIIKAHGRELRRHALNRNDPRDYLMGAKKPKEPPPQEDPLKPKFPRVTGRRLRLVVTCGDKK